MRKQTLRDKVIPLDSMMSLQVARCVGAVVIPTNSRPPRWKRAQDGSTEQEEERACLWQDSASLGCHMELPKKKKSRMRSQNGGLVVMKEKQTPATEELAEMLVRAWSFGWA